MLTNIVSRKKSTRRGITPIIAVILLLLMTVAAAGAAFLWITKFQGLVSQQMNKEVGSEQRCEGIQLSIDQVWIVGGDQSVIEFTLRNAGTYNLKEAEWKAITVTGGVAGKRQDVSDGLNRGGPLDQGRCNLSDPVPTQWDVGASYKVTCTQWGDTWPESYEDIQENDVYTVTAQPPCGTPATNSVTYTTA